VYFASCGLVPPALKTAVRWNRIGNASVVPSGSWMRCHDRRRSTLHMNKHIGSRNERCSFLQWNGYTRSAEYLKNRGNPWTSLRVVAGARNVSFPFRWTFDRCLKISLYAHADQIGTVWWESSLIKYAKRMTVDRFIITIAMIVHRTCRSHGAMQIGQFSN